MTTIRMDAFCDESYGHDHNWLYIDVLFVPHTIRQELLDELVNRRCKNHGSWHWSEQNCPHPCGFHNENDREVTYKKIGDNASRDRIATSWLKDFLIDANNRGNKGLVYFNIIGIDLMKLNHECFGPHCNRDEAVYNRFFRIAIKGAKYFFSEFKDEEIDDIVIDHIYHDKGNQESYEYFSWHTPSYLNLNDRKITVTNPTIQYVESDHRKIALDDPVLIEASHFVQFIDLIMGSFICCLAAPSNKPKKVQLARTTLPLLSRLLDAPGNTNSSYHYHRKQQISFFPSDAVDHRTYLTQTNLAGSGFQVRDSSNMFYTRREIRLPREHQSTLF